MAGGEKCNLTDNPTWIIDPIDGTTNFVHKYASEFHDDLQVIFIILFKMTGGPFMKYWWPFCC